MKKTLVALAALAATTAFAQSTVAITGNIDLGYRTVTQKGETTLGGVSTDAQTRKTSNVAGNGAEGWTSSQVVLTVSEDMGNGVKAGYVADMNLSSFGTAADASGQSLGTIRQSFLSLSDAKMGELRLGYQYTLEDQIQGGVGRATPTGNVGGRFQNFAFAVNPNAAASTIEGTGTLTSGHITRSNAFQYASPVMSGFQVLVQAAQLADKQDNATAAGSTEAKGKLTALAAKYSQGPLNLGFSHQVSKSESGTYHATTTQETIVGKTKATQFAANYDLGVAKVFLNKVSRTTDVTSGAGAGNTTAALSAFDNGGSLKRTGTDLGVSAPFGKTTLFAAVASGKYKLDTNGDGASVDYKIKGRMLGATYDLSKRTSLNAYYAMTKATYEAQTTDLSKKAVGFGIRHQF
jgi:predicted porin